MAVGVCGEGDLAVAELLHHVAQIGALVDEPRGGRMAKIIVAPLRDPEPLEGALELAIPPSVR